MSTAIHLFFFCRKDPTTEEQKCCRHPERRECRLQHVTNRSWCCVLLDRLIPEADFLEIGENVGKNDFLKDVGQKWKDRDGTVVFRKILVK